MHYIEEYINENNIIITVDNDNYEYNTKILN